MTAMDDLTAFIAARLDEDEAMAKAATPAPWRGTVYVKDDQGVITDASYPDDTSGFIMGTPVMSEDESRNRADVAHIARHDPARVLREVAAKRVILAFHDHVTAEGGPHEDEQVCTACGAYGDDWWHATGWPCRTIRELAAVWSDHPDYRAGWAG